MVLASQHGPPITTFSSVFCWGGNSNRVPTISVCWPAILSTVTLISFRVEKSGAVDATYLAARSINVRLLNINARGSSSENAPAHLWHLSWSKYCECGSLGHHVQKFFGDLGTLASWTSGTEVLWRKGISAWGLYFGTERMRHHFASGINLWHGKGSRGAPHVPFIHASVVRSPWGWLCLDSVTTTWGSGLLGFLEGRFVDSQ